MLAGYEDLFYRKIFELLSYQQLCLSLSSRKIQHALSFNSVIETSSENVTERLEWGRSEIQPLPPIEIHRQCESFRD